MEDGQKEGPMNGYRLPNTSNIHLHGLHVNPNVRLSLNILVCKTPFYFKGKPQLFKIILEHS